MSHFAWSDDIPVLGSLPFNEVTRKLREMGDTEAATELEQAHDKVSSERGVLGTEEGDNEWWRYWDRPWSPRGHKLGYLAPIHTASQLQPIQQANAILPDNTLQNSRIKLTLDDFYVAAYPGIGTHNILIKFYTHHQPKNKLEHLYFNVLCNAGNRDHASVHSIPIFQGLNVGYEGIFLGIYTVNVQNSGDEKLLNFLKGDLFKEGLKLLTTVQPALALFSNTMQHIATQIATRRSNNKIQELEIGFDFSKIASRSQLREGSYIAIQMREQDQNPWVWDEWVYDHNKELVVSKKNIKKRLPYNYFIFSISKYVDK